MGSRSIKDSLLVLILWVVVVPLISTIAWTKFAADVSVDCEKLGGFSVNNKVYKCEKK
jgi:hypothetical protein